MSLDASDDPNQKRSGVLWRWALVGPVLLAAVMVPLIWIENPLLARAAVVAAVCLVLWLSEIVPPFVPTIILWTLAPMLLEPYGEQFRLRRVLSWSADPVLALFLGGFALGAAAQRYGIDAWIAQLAVGASRGRRAMLLTLSATATATLSMWMSNIAAAAMMIAALRPLFAQSPLDDRFRRALLVAVAMGANFGGIATPIGTGPNAIAIAHISPQQPISFLAWMSFALPLALGLLLAGLVLVVIGFGVRGSANLPSSPPKTPSMRARWIVAIFSVTVLGWLTEPLHGVSAILIALAATATLFGSGLLGREDLARIDWSTLVLIAGGIGLGNLLEQSGLVKAVAAEIPWSQMPAWSHILVLCFASALLSALMSNTATVTMLIPLAASLDPSPSTSVLIAIAASLGMPFVISTPPNAMIYGERGVKTTDLLWPGLVLMIGGCVLVSLTGPIVLRWMGVP
jgi:sodium-dependent dicarboxylate transporter 2/3/5